MTFPVIPTFRREQAPKSPAFYFDVDPSGERVDPTLVLGGLGVLEAVKEVVERAAPGEMTAIVGDLDARIAAEKQEEPAGLPFEGEDPLKINGQEAFALRSLFKKVARTPRRKQPNLNRSQMDIARIIDLNTLDHNQIPNPEKINEDQALLIAEASQLVAEPLVMFPDEHGRYDV